MYLNNDSLILVLGLCIVVPVLLLLIVAVVIALVKRGKYLKKPKVSSDVALNDKYIEIKKCFGEDNILDMKNEMSRITVSVKDVELVNAEMLKELGAKGVLFVGNDVKCSFENANEIYEAIKVK